MYIIVHARGEKKSIILYLDYILPFLAKEKKSDWHISAAKNDRCHGHPICWQGPGEALGKQQAH